MYQNHLPMILICDKRENEKVIGDILMGQWSCKCGQRMTDHTYPDKNAFLVFSQELWEEISGMTDENGMIKFEDVPLQTYDMYRCPACGSLMIFGEDEDNARFTFYDKE